MICTAEIGLFVYTKLWSIKFKYLLSLGMSYVLLILMGSEFYRGFKVLTNRQKKGEAKKIEKDWESKMSPGDKQLMEKYL